MGFNKVFLPSKEDLEQMVLSKGVTYVLNRYNGPKVDALVGDVDSMDYLDRLVNDELEK